MAAQLKEINVLIISEDIVFSSILRRFIRKHFDYVVLRQCDTIACVKSLSLPEIIDVVLLDDVLMGTATHEVVNFLRYIKKVVAPVFYFSHSGFEEEKALQQGANYFVSKPFDPDDAVKKIKSVLQKRSYVK